MREIIKRVTVYTLVLLLMIPFTAMSQQLGENTAAQSPEKVFKPEELEQMLAPVALYPDALLAQMLTAATYPLEVIAADRFVKENSGLRGEALLEAAKDKDWEPSVKAMLGFPDVLAMMDAQLEWTGKLGDAFLAQQSDCMDAVQRLRQKAYAQGSLATTQEQVIRVEPQTRIIIIEPVNPEVVYVPVYDPAIIYGDWWYPAYPPYYVYPRRYFGVSFFPGVFVGAFWGAWGTWDCNWHSRDVYVNVGHYNHFTKVSYAGGSRYRSYRVGQGDQPWRYDARHRTRAGARDSFAAVKTSTPDLRRSGQVTVRSPRIDPQENTKTSINIPGSSRKYQASIKQLPAKTSGGGDNTKNQRSIGISTREVRVQEFAKPATVTESSKNNAKHQAITRSASEDSRHRKANDNNSAAKSRGRIEHAENGDVLSNHRLAPTLQNSNVLHEGFMHAGGR